VVTPSRIPVLAAGQPCGQRPGLIQGMPAEAVHSEQGREPDGLCICDGMHSLMVELRVKAMDGPLPTEIVVTPTVKGVQYCEHDKGAIKVVVSGVAVQLVLHWAAQAASGSLPPDILERVRGNLRGKVKVTAREAIDLVLNIYIQ